MVELNGKNSVEYCIDLTTVNWIMDGIKYKKFILHYFQKQIIMVAQYFR